MKYRALVTFTACLLGGVAFTPEFLFAATPPDARIPNHARAALPDEPALPTERIVVVANLPGSAPALRDLARFAVNAGPAASLLDADVRRSAFDAAARAGFRHLRFNDLLALPATAAKREDWSRADEILDDLLARNLKPILAFEITSAFNPRELARVSAFASHLRHRFGEKETATWWFEIVQGDVSPQAFFHDYEAAALALRAVDSKFLIGGPGLLSTGPQDPDLGFFVNQVRLRGVPLSFLSIRAGETHSDRSSGSSAKADNNSLARAIMPVTTQAADLKVPALVSVWSPAYPSPDDALNSTSLAAARMLTVLHQSAAWGGNQPLRSAPGFAYALLADSRSGAPGPGLLTTDGSPKPLFSAFAFLHELHPRQLPTASRRVIVTRSDDPAAGLRLLAWHYSPARTGDASLLAPDFVPAPTPDLGFEINGLPAGSHELRLRRVVHPKNIETNSPAEIVKTDSAGRLRFTLSLKQNEVCFAEIVPAP